MKNLTFTLSVFIVLLAVSCKKISDLSPLKKAAATTDSLNNSAAGQHNTTIYFSGIDGPNAVYWQNGSEHTLPISSTNNNGFGPVLAYTYNVAVADTDVYITGYNGLNFVYWENGIVHTTPVYANAMLLSASSSYFAGNDGQGNAIFSKNGSIYTLPTVGVPAYVESMAMAGTDVYFAGNNNYHAVYWKNGVEYTLPVTSSPNYSLVTAMAISGTDVYFAGQDGANAVYWKNGIETALPMNTASGYVSAMTISGTDVYFAGADSHNAVYWKNGVESTLPMSSSSSGYCIVSAMAANGSDIYIAGTEGSVNTATGSNYNIAEYWKNGAVYTLPVMNKGGGSVTGLAIASK